MDDPLVPAESQNPDESLDVADERDLERSPDRGTSRRPRRPWLPILLWLVGTVALVVALTLVTEVGFFAVLAAVVLGALILRIGWFFLQQFATPPPPPPDPGTMRRVRLTYRCPVCGAEVRMTSAATEDPEPPRHCMEEMELLVAEE